MINSKIIGIESDGKKTTLILEEKDLSDKAWENVFNGESIDEQTDFVNRRFTPFFQHSLGERLIGKTFILKDGSESYL